jgi:hypothetical protein
MPNNLNASIEERWSKDMQMKHQRVDTFRDIVSMREESELKKGDLVHRPYRSNITVNDMSSEGAYTRQDVSATDEQLSIDKEKESTIYLKELDEIQSRYALARSWAQDQAKALSNGIDGDVNAEVANALNDVDNTDFGGATSGQGILITESNIFDVFLYATEKLDRRNAPEDGRYAVCSPQFIRVLKSALVSRETNWGDKVGENGYVGMYDNFRIYKSNGLYSTYSLALATQPTDGDTITLNIPDTEGTRSTVTFTFKTTLGSDPGNVLIGASNDTALTNLAALINAPGTTTAQGVALSAANQDLLKGVTATADTSNDLMTLAAVGKGFVVVGETLTDATDEWTGELQVQHQMFGVKGAIDLVIQVKPNVRMKSRDGYIGGDIVTWNVYGIKTFREGARFLVNVYMRADGFNAS